MIYIAFFSFTSSLCTLPWNHMVHTTAASVCSYYLLTTYMSNDFSEPWFVGLNGTKIYLKSPMTWCCTKGALRKIFYFFDLIFLVCLILVIWCAISRKNWNCVQCRTLWVRVRNAARRSREMPKWWCVVLIGSCEIAQQFSPEMRAASGRPPLFILVEQKIRLVCRFLFFWASHAF